MKNQIYKFIIGLIVFTIILICLSVYVNSKKEPNPLENIEKRIEAVEVKDKVLTDNEKELEKMSTEKEWQEVDKQTDK